MLNESSWIVSEPEEMDFLRKFDVCPKACTVPSTTSINSNMWRKNDISTKVQRSLEKNRAWVKIEQRTERCTELAEVNKEQSDALSLTPLSPRSLSPRSLSLPKGRRADMIWKLDAFGIWGFDLFKLSNFQIYNSSVMLFQFSFSHRFS